MSKPAIGKSKAQFSSSRYLAPTLTVYGSVIELTANGSKPGNEAFATPPCTASNPGNADGNNSNCHL